MKRITTVAEFARFRQRVLEEEVEGRTPSLVLCAGTGGQASGASDVLRVIKRLILEKGLQQKISLRITGCQGFCQMDPFVIVEPGGQLYPRLSVDDVARVVEAAAAGEVVNDLLYRDGKDFTPCASRDDIPFFRKQTRTLLGANLRIDPIRIMDYIA
jgi:NADH-quinone oxidoreductase subunit F